MDHFLPVVDIRRGLSCWISLATLVYPFDRSAIRPPGCSVLFGKLIISAVFDILTPVTWRNTVFGRPLK